VSCDQILYPIVRTINDDKWVKIETGSRIPLCFPKTKVVISQSWIEISSRWYKCAILRMWFVVVIAISYCIGLPNFIQVESNPVDLSIFQDGDHDIANLLPVAGLVTALVQEVEIYLQTRFRRDLSIQGWDITTLILLLPVFEKTATISEFYFRFAMWSHVPLWDDALCNPTKYSRHVSIPAEIISIYSKNPIYCQSPSWICNTVLLDHPRSRIGGLKKCRKFCQSAH